MSVLGGQSIVLTTIIFAPFAIFVFNFNSVPMVLFGIGWWGIDMGRTGIYSESCRYQHGFKNKPATGYGIFQCSFGLFWFLGNGLLGVLYDISIPTR